MAGAIAAVATSSIRVLGYVFAADESATGAAAFPVDETLAAAKVGQLTTRTDNDTGVLTMDAGHGFATSDRLDVYWAGGSRYGMTATVATNAVTVDGGSGDNLPANMTDVTAMKAVLLTTGATGDNAQLVACKNPSVQATGTGCAATFAFTESDDTPIVAYRPDAGESKSWSVTTGATNPFAGVTVSRLYVSHGDSTASVRLQAVLVYN